MEISSESLLMMRPLVAEDGRASASSALWLSEKHDFATLTKDRIERQKFGGQNPSLAWP